MVKNYLNPYRLHVILLDNLNLLVKMNLNQLNVILLLIQYKKLMKVIIEHGPILKMKNKKKQNKQNLKLIHYHKN